MNAHRKLTPRQAFAVGRAAEARRVQWTAEMVEALFRLYLRGRHTDVIAQDIGVARYLVTQKMREFGLPNRRHTPCRHAQINAVRAASASMPHHSGASYG